MQRPKTRIKRIIVNDVRNRFCFDVAEDVSGLLSVVLSLRSLSITTNPPMRRTTSSHSVASRVKSSDLYASRAKRNPYEDADLPYFQGGKRIIRRTNRKPAPTHALCFWFIAAPSTSPCHHCRTIKSVPQTVVIVDRITLIVCRLIVVKRQSWRGAAF